MIVLYENVLRRAGVVPELGEPLLDDDTTTRWWPADGGSVAFEALPFVQITHIGIAAHNLGSVSGSLLIETYDGSSWLTLTTIAPTNDDAMLLPVTPTAATGIRITATGNDIRLAVFYAGEALEFERRIYQGHTPISFSKNNDLVVKSQGGGQYLGNRVRRLGASTTYAVKHLTPQFVRRKLEGFRQHYNEGGRFFLSWRPDQFPDDAIYGYGDGNMSPTNTGPAAFMAVDFSVIAYQQTPGYYPSAIVPPTPVPWTPAQLTTSLWLDASDISTLDIDGSDRVSEWRDKSGNSRDYEQLSTGFMPAYESTGNAGSPTVYFSTSRTLERAVWDSGKNHFFIAAVKPTTGGDRKYVFHGSAIALSNNNSKVGFFSGSSWEGAATPTSNSQLLSWSLDYSTLTGETRRNGSVLESGLSYTGWNVNEASENITEIGGRRQFSDWSISRVSEVIKLDSIPSAQDVEKLEGYLAWKWGLESELPVLHPYKNERPMT